MMLVQNNPYISFVVVGRNDNYGGNFLHRINVFVKNLITLVEKYKLDSELIIVEWNPLNNKPSLRDAISWPDIKRESCQVRFIEVPNEVHAKLPNPAKLHLFEYIGKNVGVRRAHGEYILSTNPDVIFSEELIRFLASKKLSNESFYRIDRYDVKSPVPLDVEVEELLNYCQKNVIRVYSNLGTFDKKWSKVYFLYKKLRCFAGKIKRKLLFFQLPSVHTNASGDFLLMHRDHWNELRAYPELETKGKSHHIDSLLVYMVKFNRLKQVILKNPLRLYHQDHGRPDGTAKPRSQAVDLAYNQLLTQRKPIILNNEKWGLADENLPEMII